MYQRPGPRHTRALLQRLASNGRQYSSRSSRHPLSFAFMSSDGLATASGPRLKPRLRGVLHQYAFGLAVLAGAILVAAAETARARISVAVYAVSLAAMFGSSALYHRITWPPAQRRRLRRLDHAAIYLLIAGTYTPFGTLALSGSSGIAVLAVPARSSRSPAAS